MKQCPVIGVHVGDYGKFNNNVFAPHAGDKRLFIRSDELEAAWDLFTPLLHEIETRKVCSTAVGECWTEVDWRECCP